MAKRREPHGNRTHQATNAYEEKEKEKEEVNLDSQQVSLDGEHISFPTLPAGLSMVPHANGEWLFEYARGEQDGTRKGFFVWVDGQRYSVDRPTWQAVQMLVLAL